MSNEGDATACNDVQPLSAKQARAVDLLAAGASDREAAEMLGCDPSTIWRWRTRDPSFRAALNARRSEIWRVSLDRVRSLLPRALDVIERALEEDDRHAALSLLKLGGLATVNLGLVGPSDPRVIAETEERERVRGEQEQVKEEVRAALLKDQLETRQMLAGLH